jgi:type IV pilus assembly protein PilN
MIKINLLKLREEKKKVTYRNQFIIAGVALAGLLIVIVIMQIRISQKISNVKQQIQTTQAEIKKYEAEVGKVEDFKKKREDLEKKVKAIESLEKGKDLPARILWTLAKSIPYQEGTAVPKKIQITNMTIKGTGIQLKGYALNEESLVFFIKNLENTDVFNNVVLVSTSLVDQKGAKLNEFDISAVIAPVAALESATATDTKKTKQPGEAPKTR